MLAADKMRHGAPRVIRKRSQTSHSIDAKDCGIGGQCSVRDRAQGRAAVTRLHLLQLCGAALKLNKSLRGRDRGSVGRGVG